MREPSRRDVLWGLGVTGLAASCDPGDIVLPEPIDRPEPDTPWTNRPATSSVPHAAIGDPTPEGRLRVVARVIGATDAGAWVEAATWDTAAGWTPVEGGPREAPDDGGYVAFELTDLPPDTAIAWQVVTEAGASEVGHARTFPAPDAAVPLRLMVSSCSDHEHVDFPSLVTAADRGPVDLYIGLGDTVYCDGCYGLDTYRDRWARTLATSGYRHLFANAATAFIWDDHEVVNNWSGDTADPIQVANARQAMREAVPVRPDPGHPERMWRRLSFGLTADVFIADVRSERNVDTGEYISETQLAWLIDGVQASRATWKVLCIGVPVTDLGGVFDVPLALNDTWKAPHFAEQRRRFLDGIAGVEGVIILTGDHHFPAIARPDPDGPAASVWEVFTGPLGSNRPPVHEVLERSEDLPWFARVWCCHRIDLSPHGWAHITVVGEADETWFDAYLHADGRLLSFTETPDPGAGS